MTNRRQFYWKLLALFAAVSLSFPVMADAGSGGRGKTRRASSKSARSGSVRTRQSTRARPSTTRSRGSVRRSTTSSRASRAISRRSSTRVNRNTAGRSSRSLKSSVSRRSPTRSAVRRPTTSVSSASVRAPSSSSSIRGQRTQITPQRVIRDSSGGIVNRSSSSTGIAIRSSDASRGARPTRTTAPRSGTTSVVISGGGRSRSNFDTARSFSGRNDGRSHGRSVSGSGVVAINNQANARGDSSSVGQRGGRKFNSGHGATGAPFAGSVFINNNVSRYGRAYDRSDVFHDGQSFRSVNLSRSGSYGNRSGHRDGHGNRGGYDRYRHAYGNQSYFDNAFYFGSHYYGRRHHQRNYNVVYYPAYRSYDYGYGYPYGVSSYPYTYPLTHVGVSTQTYYEVDPAVEQVYEDAIAEPDAGTVYAPPAQAGNVIGAPSAPQAGANQASPQVGQIQIPQAVVDGHQAFARHDVVKARHAYLTAVLADNEDGYAKLFYAMASIAGGEYDVASLALRGAMETASELVTDPIDWRQFYVGDDQVKADLEALVAFNSMNAGDVDSQFLLAYFHYSMGQAEEAQQVLMSVPGSVYAKDGLMKELRDAVGAVVSGKQDQP